MASKTFVQIREIFAGFFPNAKTNAADQAAFSIRQIESECKNGEQLVLRLSQEKIAIRHEIDSLEKKEFYCSANDESIIFLIYCSRIFCNDRDEEQDIRQGLILSERYRQVNEQLLKAKKQLPLFTSAHFHANKKNVAFYQLNEQPFGTPKKDYLEMRSWQAHRKGSCAVMEFRRLKDNFVAAVPEEEKQAVALQREINQLEKILDQALSWSKDQLFEQLFILKGLNGLTLPQDKEGFHRLLNSCIKGEKLDNLLSPKYLDTVSLNICRGIISSPPIFYYTLLMYGRWLCDVYSGIKEMSDNGEDSLDDLFYKAYRSGLQLGKSAIDKFRNKKRKRQLTANEYVSELKQECRRYYQLYKDLAYPHYFCQLAQRERLRNSFIEDCLASVNIELPVLGLKKAIEINETVEFLFDEMIINEANKKLPKKELPFNREQMVELFCYLAPDTVLIRQMLELLAKVSESCQNEQIPLFFIQQELNDCYYALIKKAEKIYNKTLGFMDPELRGYFLSGQLRSLKHMGRFYDLENSSLRLPFKYIKQIQKEELKSAHELQSFHPAEIKDNGNKKEKDMDKPFNFGYHQGPKELMPILKAMDLKMNMLANGSTMDDLMEVLTCKDLSKNTKKVYIGFTILKLAYFRKKAEPWFTSFTAANIERSGAFISSKEGVINAHLLYNSKLILKEDSDRIDDIFNAKYR